MSNKWYTDVYLKSDHWRKFRSKMLVVKHFKCEKCKKLKEPQELQVHHKHYDSLWREKPNDIMVLCSLCHRREDEQRRWMARLNGWATKLYGYNWIVYHDIGEVEAEFINWLKENDYDIG